MNSHFHWDHSQGNAAFKKAHPQVTIMSSTGTRALLSEQAVLRLKGSLDETSAGIEQMKDKLGKAKTAEDRRFYQTQIAESQAYLTEMKNYAPEIPSVTIGRDLVLHDKMHDLHLAFRGRAHTAGDMLHGFQAWFTAFSRGSATAIRMNGPRPCTLSPNWNSTKSSEATPMSSKARDASTTWPGSLKNCWNA